jgi:hypothetical protein
MRTQTPRWRWRYAKEVVQLTQVFLATFYCNNYVNCDRNTIGEQDAILVVWRNFETGASRLPQIQRR